MTGVVGHHMVSCFAGTGNPAKGTMFEVKGIINAVTVTAVKKDATMETKRNKRQNDEQQETAVVNAVVIQRVFSLPLGTVWRALTNAEDFKKWWGPKDFTTPYCDMEATVGSRYLSCMRSPDGKDYWSTGVVRELEPERKLVLTDSFSDEKGNVVPASDYGMPGDWPRELLVSFELEEADGATKLRLVHEGVPAEMHDECRQGWEESFEKLEKNLK